MKPTIFCKAQFLKTISKETGTYIFKLLVVIFNLSSIFFTNLTPYLISCDLPAVDRDIEYLPTKACSRRNKRMGFKWQY